MGADALSRMPIKDTTSSTEADVAACVSSVRYAQPASDQKLEEIHRARATRDDAELQAAVRYTLEGWPRRRDGVIAEAQPYHHVRDELSMADGLLLRGVCIIIPKVHRPEMLSRIHDGYQGTLKCCERAKQGIWWPGLSSQISEIVTNYEHCQIHRNAQQHEPLIPTYIPERPWQHISADLCEFKGKYFLIIMDYYSQYVKVINISSTTPLAIVNTMKNVFLRWGTPDLVISDNGGQFDSTIFTDFAESYEFCHETSSPKFPQSNGEAERAVQIAKSILRQPDPQLALMTYLWLLWPRLATAPRSWWWATLYEQPFLSYQDSWSHTLHALKQ